MKRLILLSSIILILLGCSEITNEKLTQGNYQIIKTDNLFQTKKDIENVTAIEFGGNKITVKFKVKNDQIIAKTSKGNTLFSKKYFTLSPIAKNLTINYVENFLKLQDELKQKQLISFSSKIISITSKTTTANYFFQENFDKRIIESNRRRDGVIFRILNDNRVKVEHYGPTINKDSLALRLEYSIAQIINNEIGISCFIDIQKLIDFNSIIKSYDKENLDVAYYLNPVSNKIEPLLYFSKDVDTQFYTKYLSTYIEDDNKCSDNNYLEVFKVNSDTLTLVNTNLIIEKAITIPKGYTVLINGGATIDIINNGFICSYSPILFNGIETDSVIFTSSDNSSNGFHVFNTSQKSFLNYVSFNNFKNLYYNGWSLPSAVTFYESPVEINHCLFNQNNCEDGLNIFRAPYTISNSTVKNTFSDAFDADFSDGSITNCSFINSGNDGIDISGSKLELTNCTFNNIADKALSAGENSFMNVDSISIEKTALAVVAKDLSSITITNSIIKDCDVAYSAFQKKKEFGSSKIKAAQVKISNVKEEYLIETDSSLKIRDIEVVNHRDDVKSILYGNEFGKATVK